jgi:hypothetical protein
MLRTLGLLTFATTVAALALSAVNAPVHARQNSPKLNKTQRDTLQAIVAEVDRAIAAPETADVTWQTHVLRTSDGAHYVAFNADGPDAIRPTTGAIVYVRLATRPASQFAEKSAVMEWLKGMRSDPLVAKKRGGIAFGEMPVFGAAGIAVRGPGQQTSDLALLAMERERARERREAAERERKAALEGTANARPRDAVFPFEDFTVDLTVASGIALQRSITAGPGEYDLYVAWAKPPVKGAPVGVQVLKRSLDLPAASTTEFALSSVILADSVATRETPYPPDQQSSHPYAIGSMEIVPARDQIFTNDERLTLVLQVMNARANDAGKPDVSIGFQLFRITPDGERSVAMLNPQHYNATTLPPDFDLSKGHPMFAAMAAPLKTLPRGEYRLKIGATDKLSSRSVITDTTFTIVATAATLLSTAPVSAPFRRETLLERAVLAEAATRLTSAPMSPAFSAALDAAREARFVDLLRDDAIEPKEQPARTTLRGIGLFAMGDPRMASTLLRQSIQAAPHPAAHIYLGASRALEVNDRDAVAAWHAALDAGMPSAIVTPLLVDAYIRIGDIARAFDLTRPLVVNGVPDASILRPLGTIHVAQGREGEAIPLIEQHLAAHADDVEAQYVLLHALFAGHVNKRGIGATPEGRERFRTVAERYVAAKGRHAAIVTEWLGMGW